MNLLERLERGEALTQAEFARLIGEAAEGDEESLFAKARAVRERHYGKDVYLRGLIEFTNYCRNDCYYCGIRGSNRGVLRYRLSREEILDCCSRGYGLGLRTFVLQGGEDGSFTDEKLCGIVAEIRSRWPDCAITLSCGERSAESYRALYEAGANRYLLRHETADDDHYRSLHPAALSPENRRRCLRDLKEIGYQVGSGFMVGSPGQTVDHLAADLRFLQELHPHMVGIGPFVPHGDTPFAGEKAGSARLTLLLLALVRIMLPRVLLPATTALGTVARGGWERGVLAGANVIMPSLTPLSVRGHYALYDGKDPTSAEERENIAARMEGIGYRAVTARGDSLSA